MITANDIQVGGQHYKKPGTIQHWDMAARAELGYFEGQITKYFSRFESKNGLQDIDKGLHFVEKLIELAEHNRRCQANQAATFHITEFCRSQGFDNALTSVLTLCVTWRSATDLFTVQHDMAHIRRDYNSRTATTSKD